MGKPLSFFKQFSGCVCGNDCGEEDLVEQAKARNYICSYEIKDSGLRPIFGKVEELEDGMMTFFSEQPTRLVCQKDIGASSMQVTCFIEPCAPDRDERIIFAALPQRLALHRLFRSMGTPLFDVIDQRTGACIFGIKLEGDRTHFVIGWKQIWEEAFVEWFSWAGKRRIIMAEDVDRDFKCFEEGYTGPAACTGLTDKAKEIK